MDIFIKIAEEKVYIEKYFFPYFFSKIQAIISFMIIQSI